MKVDSVKNITNNYTDAGLLSNGNEGHVLPVSNLRHVNQKIGIDSVSFRGGGSNFSKKAWYLFRRISDYMKEKSELTSAEIAFIGTAIIAPFAILVSPGKGKKKGAAKPTEEERQHAKEKKFFQAIRQPVSAFLAFVFQLPTTLGIAKMFDYFAYKKKSKVFRDDIIEDLIPDKKYLKKQAKAVLKGRSSSELKAAWEEELKIANDTEKITNDLMAKLRAQYEEVGISVSDEKLQKMANKEKRRTKYIAEQMADVKHKKLLDNKIEQLKEKHFDFKDVDLVTEDYQNLAKHRFKSEFKALEENAKLNTFDKIVKSMGFSNGKLSKLEEAKKALAKEKGLILLQEDNPGILQDQAAKFRKYIETKSAAAQKVYGNKVFWFTLVTNLIMVAISCTALNMLHPRFADFVDGVKEARKEEKERKLAAKMALRTAKIDETPISQKVQVSA